MAKVKAYTGNECAFCGEARTEVLVEVSLREPVLSYRGDVGVCRSCLWLIDQLRR